VEGARALPQMHVYAAFDQPPEVIAALPVHPTEEPASHQRARRCLGVADQADLYSSGGRVGKGLGEDPRRTDAVTPPPDRAPRRPDRLDERIREGNSSSSYGLCPT